MKTIKALHVGAALVAVAGSILLLNATTVQAERADPEGGGKQSLRGTFAFTTTQNCVNTTVGFSQNQSLLPAPLDADNDHAASLFYTNAVVDGTRVFDGQGNFHQDFHASTINLATLPPGTPLTSVVGDSDGTYQVGEDGIVSTKTTIVHFIYISGPRTGKSGTVTGITGNLQILPGHRLLLHAASEPTVETVDFAGFSPPVLPAVRPERLLRSPPEEGQGLTLALPSTRLSSAPARRVRPSTMPPV